DRGPYDSHPPLQDRIAAIDALAIEPESGWGDRPALELLTDPTPLLDSAVMNSLSAEAAAKTRVDWATLSHIGARARREMARGEVLPELSALVALAFSDAGLAHWELDWLGRTTFVTSASDFDMTDHLDAAVAGTTSGLRDALAAAGVAPDYRPAR
ncbi:MAG TPA: hypothetical protein VF821_14860, partial [Lentzea sp.]